MAPRAYAAGTQMVPVQKRGRITNLMIDRVRQIDSGFMQPLEQAIDPGLVRGDRVFVGDLDRFTPGEPSSR